MPYRYAYHFYYSHKQDKDPEHFTKFLPEGQRRDIMYALQKLFTEQKAVNLRSVSTETLTQAFHWYNNEELEQHDVQELNRILFDLLERALKDTEYENEMPSLYK